MTTLCRRCGRKPAATADGFCVPCKSKEVRGGKLSRFGRRLDGMNKVFGGGIVE